MKKTIMRKYAQLVVKTGVNIKKGQGCVIFAQVDQHEFAEMVAEEAYRAGAKWVQMQWQDQDFLKLQFRHETVTQRSRVEEWEKARQQFIVDELPVRISITSEDPDGLKGVNVDKMQKINAARGKVLKPYRDAIENKHQWTIVAVPSKKWAKKVFPNERTSVAVEKLWEAILQSVRVEADNDPQAEWDKHNKTIIEKCEKLTAYDFDYLHYESLDGTFFNPNMPTEEAFTSPMKGKCEGTLVATLPLSYQGNLIDKFSITFKDGRAVSCQAGQGQALLEKMIAMDEGAAMLGELALVPDNSPISNSGILFYNTLFDENAACHVALGMGFNDTIPGYADMSKEEIAEKGINDSIIHVDFMVGSKDLDITGYTRDGQAVPIFRGGNWAI